MLQRFFPPLWALGIRCYDWVASQIWSHASPYKTSSLLGSFGVHLLVIMVITRRKAPAWCNGYNLQEKKPPFLPHIYPQPLFLAKRQLRDVRCGAAPQTNKQPGEPYKSYKPGQGELSDLPACVLLTTV